MNLTFRRADAQDAASIAALINAAYRGESSRQGWTTEADLLEGLRTEVDEVQQLLATEHCMMLLCQSESALVASVMLEKSDDAAHLGMFAVRPTQQGRGIGKQLLDFAEHTAKETWASQRIVMSVISRREELLAFYLRRGYQRTGVFRSFPMESALWTPLVTDLRLELLEKRLT